jgi:hypothetical protein
MLQGTCINNDILPAGETFYLFPANAGYVYASRFPRKGAHTGCFSIDRFRVIQEDEASEWPPEPPKRAVDIERETVYKAKLIWCWKAVQDRCMKEYYVIARRSETFVYYYNDHELTGLLGCLPVHWFENFQHIEAASIIECEETMMEQESELEKFEEEPKTRFIEQLSLF